jgi:hypothetical protein
MDANTIIKGALGMLAIRAPGEAVSGQEAADCLDRLNLILDGWETQSLYAQAVVRVTASVTTATATIGDTLDFDTPNPIGLEPGCFYSLNGLDYPIEIINTDEFNAIDLKSITAMGPEVVYFEKPETLYFWPVPEAGTTVTLMVLSRLAQIPSLTQQLDLPSGTARALTYTLAEEIAPDYKVPVPPSVSMRAAAARRQLKRANVRVPQLSIGDRFVRWWRA